MGSIHGLSRALISLGFMGAKLQIFRLTQYFASVKRCNDGMNIDRKLIDDLYRRFRRRPSTLDERNLRLLADFIVEERGISLEADSLVFTESAPDSPVREILLENINGVADLGRHIAIVLHSSIIFFNKDTLQTSVHLRPLSRLERLLHRF